MTNDPNQAVTAKLCYYSVLPRIGKPSLLLLISYNLQRQTPDLNVDSTGVSCGI